MTLYVDGFVYGANPSSKGGGFTVTDSEGKVLKQEERLKAGFTNNEAELLAVINAAVIASFGSEIITDSQNAIAWVRSGKPKARPDLTDLACAARELVRVKGLKLTWQPRETNPAGKVNEELHLAAALLI